MSARTAILGTPDMQQPLLQIHLIPPQRDQFRDPERMSEGHQDQGTVTMPMSSSLSSSIHERLYLVLCQVLTAPQL
jgi:hypothetical protein